MLMSTGVSAGYESKVLSEWTSPSCVTSYVYVRIIVPVWAQCKIRTWHGQNSVHSWITGYLYLPCTNNITIKVPGLPEHWCCPGSVGAGPPPCPQVLLLQSKLPTWSPCSRLYSDDPPHKALWLTNSYQQKLREENARQIIVFQPQSQAIND